MSNRHYDASITDNGNWSWNDANVPPDARAGDARGHKPLYILQRGDTLVLRVKQKQGLHTIKLCSEPYQERTPFAYPFDLHTFSYDPDDPAQKLICVGHEELGAQREWSFKIKGPDGCEIDPEFQVGVGGHPGD